MQDFLLMVTGGVIVLAVEYSGKFIFKHWLSGRRFSPYESAVLQSIAFLECERHGQGAEAILKIGNEVFEDWDHLAAFEKLLAEGYIEKFPDSSKFGLSARGQLIATDLFERSAPMPYKFTSCSPIQAACQRGRAAVE